MALDQEWFGNDGRRRGREDAPDISWVEARSAAKHPTMRRTTPHNKELSRIQNANSAEVEKPWARWKEEISESKVI